MKVFTAYSTFGVMLTAALITPFGAMAQSSPVPVDLGTAGDFALLAKTGISVTGAALITGDVGVSPVAATYITGCGPIMDASGTFSTSSLVVGKIYAADYTAPTPTKMTTAVGDMETAYTDAAGRTLPDYTEQFAGDLTGKTLTHGLYKWSTGVMISAAGVTISGTATDVWIFQIAGTLTVASGAIVTLSGGALARNIFWQVAGQTTFGTTADFKGIILCKTLIEMQTGATLNGRALAQTAVTIDGNAVSKPAVAVMENGPAPQKSTLYQNYSNQSVVFMVPSNGKTTLRLLNMFGQDMMLVFSGEAEAGKYHRVKWNSSGLAKGLYVSKLESNGTVNLERLLVK